MFAFKAQELSGGHLGCRMGQEFPLIRVLYPCQFCDSVSVLFCFTVSCLLIVQKQ